MVNTDNLQALAQALLFLKGNPKLSRQMTDRAQKYVFENYAIEEHMTKIQKLYESLLKPFY